ncbi:MAG: hypothetical protein R2838_00825 [Caldilineaceae bacterium]
MAEALRELVWRREDKHLTVADSRMLDQARTMLVHEMALATDTDLPVIGSRHRRCADGSCGQIVAAAAAKRHTDHAVFALNLSAAGPWFSTAHPPVFGQV